MAATGESVFNFLTQNELQTLSEGVKNKLAAQFEISRSRVEELQITVERLGVDADQKYFELEKHYITSNTLFEEEAKKSKDLAKKLEECATKLEEQSTKITALEEQAREAEVLKVQLQTKCSALELEKNDLNFQLEKKLKEIDNLQDEWKQMSEKIGSANTAKLEAQTKLEEIKSKEMALSYQQQRADQERDQLTRQNAWLEEELSKKSDELFTIRRDLSGRVLELTRSLDEKTEELTRSEETAGSLKQTVEAHTARMGDYVEKIREMRESEMKQEEQVKKELQARDKLINLYKSSLEEQDKKSRELMSAVEELQKVLHNANDVAKQAAEEKEALENDLNRLVAEKEERIVDLEKELDVANGIIATGRRKGNIPLSEENVEALSPTAAAASKLLKSGKTLTQIYSEYVTATETLQMEKMENARLNQYLDRILQDIEEKAPRMKKQREDYEQALLTINHLTSQLDGAMAEVEKLRLTADDGTRKWNQFQRENNRLKQQTDDLARQVKYLIKELEESRGARVTTVHDDADLSSGEVTSSSQIISERLVTFGSIEELQEQNQKLLNVVRELSQKNEDEERKAVDEKTSAIQTELELVKKKLDDQAAARIRQAELFESVVRQRDMYSVLLAQSQSSGGAVAMSMFPNYPTTPLHASTPRPGARPQPDSAPTSQGALNGGSPGAPGGSLEAVQQARDALKQLRDEYDSYKKDRRENDKMLSDQVESLKKELSAMRVQNAKLASQLDYSLERFKIVQGNSESYKKEIAAIREKNQQYTASIIKHEQTVNTLREDLMANQTRLTRAEVEAQNLRSQLNLAKSTESRLLQERETMHREHHSQTVLMANLQAIQNNLERQEFDIKTKLGSQLSALEKECIELRRKVASSDGEHKAVRDMMQSRIDEAAKKLKEQTELRGVAEEKVKAQQEQQHQLQQELLVAEGKLTAAESRIAKLTRDPKLAANDAETQAEVLNELRAQVENLQQEKKELELKLEQMDQHCQQYKAIAQSIEESLKEHNKASEEFKQTMNERMQEVKKENEVLSTRCQNLEKECHDRLQENIKISEESHNLNAELRKRLSTAQTELEEAVSRREEAIVKEQQAREDLQKQVDVAREAQDKYERELVLHAADMEKLRETKAELSGFNMKLVKAEAEARAAQTELESQKQSWLELEKQKTDEHKKLEARYIELCDQNEVLHEQMEKLSNQVVSVQQLCGSERQSLDVSLSEDSAKSSEQLMEVIRFLRREKEIADTKYQVTDAENSRLITRITALTKQVDEMSASMADERQSAQVSMVTALEHSELMKKVETLNLLSDSNKLLREEKERLVHQLRETEEKCRKLEEDIAPLQSRIRDLQALVDAAKTEKLSLQSEVDRWKLRVNNLIEQSDKTDPEERKRLINEREDVKKELNKVKEELAQAEVVRADIQTKLNASKEECTRLKAEISRNTQTHNNAISSKTTELTQAKQLTEKVNKEMKTMKENFEKELKAKSDKLEENNGLINQLKRLGRKYKTEVETVTKELAQVRKEKESQAETETEQTSQNEERVRELQTQVEEWKNKCEEMERKKQSTDLVQSAHEETVKNLTTELEELRNKTQGADKTQQELAESQAKEGELRKANADLEKKLDQLKDMLQKVKTKITSQKTEISTLSGENEELKRRVDGQGQGDAEVEKVRTSYQTQVTNLNQQNDQLAEELTELKNVLADTRLKLDSTQKLSAEWQRKFQELQARSAAMSKVTPAQVDRAIKSVHAKSTPRANIQPMSSPSPTTARQSAPVPPTSRATASIRPMAISHSSHGQSSHGQSSHGSGSHGQAPTATVMPTPQDQGPDPDSEPEATPSTSSGTSRQPPPSSLSQQASKRPRDDSLDSSIEPDRMKRSKQEMESETSMDDSVTESPEPSTAPIVEVHPRVSEPVAPQPAPSAGPLTSQAAPMTSQAGPLTSQVGPLMTEAPQDREEGNLRVEIVLSDEESAEDMMQETGVDEEEEEEEGDEEEGGEDEMDDSIEEEEVEIEGDLGEEDPVDVESFGSEEAAEAEESGEEESEEGGEQSDVEEEDEEEDDDDVVIIDDENGEGRDEGTHEASGHGDFAPPSAAISSQAPSSEQQAARAQLPSFSFAAGGAGFEEGGDDCRVPGTPTISAPSRNDGLAELHSPERRGFPGAGYQEAEPNQSQLQAQEGIGVDDTKVDLSSYDEAGTSGAPEAQSASEAILDDLPVEEAADDDFLETVDDIPSTATDTERGAGDHPEESTSRDPQEEAKQSAQTRRIEPIVWEEPSTRPAPAAQPQSQPIASLAPSRPQMAPSMNRQRQQQVQSIRGQMRTGPQGQGASLLGRGPGIPPQRGAHQRRGHHQGRAQRSRGRGGRGMYRQQPF